MAARTEYREVSNVSFHVHTRVIAYSIVPRGYYNNPQANADTFTPDGWLKTGDVVVRDADGMLYVVDRKKELVKYKGFQGLCPCCIPYSLRCCK